MSGIDTVIRATSAQSRFGVVAIGRNEGDRLRRCLESVRTAAQCVVYVDSGSTDGSREVALNMGVQVVALDLTRPFTAARARNQGWHQLLAVEPQLDYVQFVDGDCEVIDTWLEVACSFLDTHPDVAAVAGRNRERFPQRSVYNLLCDVEWGRGAAGTAKECGGNAMMRTAALTQSGGFCETLIAGEEPELCVRMRAAGWRVWRLDDEMTLHDAAMTRFSQWWKRAMRAGFSYAEGVRMHGAPPERFWVREWRSAWMWGAGIPVLVLLLFSVGGPISLWALAIYPAQVVRLGLRAKGSPRERWASAFFLVLGKFPEVLGQIKSWRLHSRGRPAVLIEYK